MLHSGKISLKCLKSCGLCSFTLLKENAFDLVMTSFSLPLWSYQILKGKLKLAHFSFFSLIYAFPVHCARLAGRVFVFCNCPIIGSFLQHLVPKSWWNHFLMTQSWMRYKINTPRATMRADNCFNTLTGTRDVNGNWRKCQFELSGFSRSLKTNRA